MKRKLITLLSLLLSSTILVTAAGGWLKYGILKDLGLFQDASLVAVPFMVMADKAAQFALSNAVTNNQGTQIEATEVTQATEDPFATEPTEVVILTETEPVVVETEPIAEPPTEAPTEPVVIEIDESWFDDALFIGDSRTADMRDMARLGDADYFCATSITVFQIMNTNCSDKDFYKKNLDYVLSNKTYGKVYIHLGLNELTYGPDLILEKYTELIDMIRQKQPDAIIVVQSVMTVRDYFAKQGKFTLERITELNRRLKEFADEKGIFYEETNDWAANEEGYMRPEISYDGAHPIGTGYIEWSQWILENAKNWGIP